MARTPKNEADRAVHVTVSVPRHIKDKMTEFNYHVNWSAVAKAAFEVELAKLAINPPAPPAVDAPTVSEPLSDPKPLNEPVVEVAPVTPPTSEEAAASVAVPEVVDAPAPTTPYPVDVVAAPVAVAVDEAGTVVVPADIVVDAPAPADEAKKAE